MKIITNIFIFGLILLTLSCKQQSNKKLIDTVVIDSTQFPSVNNEQERIKQQKEIEEEEITDSIRLRNVLDKALEIANQNLKQCNFSKEFESIPNSAYTVTTKLKMGNFFSLKYKHIIIHRESPHSINIDVYLVSNNKLKNVLSHQEWSLTYVSDTLKDVNGDGYKDFVLNWYGSNGCCLKAFSDVFLFQKDKGDFTEYFEFINPTFYPKEKVIRGVCYGHPGETEMYTYRWDGNSIDTVEYVYFEKNDTGEKTGKIIRSKHKPYSSLNQKIKRLDSIPNEYKEIEGYDWFTGDGY